MSMEQYYANNSSINQKMFESVYAVEEKPKVIAGEPLKFDGEAMLEAMGEQLERGEALAAVYEWVESGEPTADSFDAFAQSLAEIDDESDEITEEDEMAYADALNSMADALVFLGAKEDAVESLLSGTDKAANDIYLMVSEAEESEDMLESIANFSVGTEKMFEAKQKVVRDGKVKWIKKPLRKKRLSAAQRAGLKKARLKSNTSAARLKRKKSMKRRKAFGG